MRLTPPRRFPAALALSVLGGLVAYLAFPPVGAWTLAFVSPAILIVALTGAGPGRGFVLGLAYGLTGFGLTLSWLFLFGALAWGALTLLAALSVALFGALLPMVRRPAHPIVTAIGAAALWTAIDWLRGLVPFGGFTWGSLGVAQVSNRVTVRLAVIAGVWGVTFVVAFAATLLAEAAIARKPIGRRLALVAVAIAAALAPIVIPFATTTGRPVDVAAIQVDFLEGVAGLPRAEGDVAVTRLNLELHETLRDDPPDLAVWGESALDPGSLAILDEVRSTIADIGAPVLSGSTSVDIHTPERRDGPLHNQAVLFDDGGAVADAYRKTHLVPYGEYIPLKRLVGWIPALDQIAYQLEPGDQVHTLRAPGLPELGTPICFENSFAALDRRLVLEGAELLVVLTNNAAYRDSAASAQHLQMSRMRAIEDGRWVVHAAVSGISAFIGTDGRAHHRTDLFEPAVIRQTVRASTERTAYVRLGDWLPILSVVVAVGLAAVPRGRRRDRPAPEALGPDARTLVILPTFDEAKTIRDVVVGVLAYPGVDVLVVDDASPDGTADVVRALMTGEPRIRLVERPVRSGLASAYLSGFGLALDEGYEVIVEMDSDLSHDPEELGRLLAAARDRFDLVVGSRYVPGGSVTNWSRFRLALSKVGNTYARIMLGIPLHDATSGYRAYRRDLLQDLVAEPVHADGYGFQVELVMRTWLHGWTLGEVPITFREREHGHSKLSRRIVAEALWLVTKWGVSLRLLGRPHRPASARHPVA
ncbi:MAG TPA: apolipoprotein N-acyltransferase [Actinomycetota bacterium]|nr:apolipoprotein N-acyltransferase [Actinomycetota bacterium]